MWKRISLIFIIFLITISCANQESTNVPALNTTDEIKNAPSLGAYFPQTNNILDNTDALVRGKLTLDNGCLRVSETNTINGDSYLLIWDSRFSTRTEQRIVQVIDSSTGELLASVGDYIEVGGGVVVDVREMEMALKELLPQECSEPYWLVGDSIKKIDRP